MISRRSAPFTRPALFVCAVVLGAAPVACSVPHATAPPRIAGGTFEASGVVDVPGTNGVLFVDDNRTTEIFWMELTAERRQAGPAVKIPLGATVIDPEAMASDGAHYYLVGSQSIESTEGDGIIRFRFDASRRQDYSRVIYLLNGESRPETGSRKTAAPVHDPPLRRFDSGTVLGRRVLAQYGPRATGGVHSSRHVRHSIQS